MQFTGTWNVMVGLKHMDVIDSGKIRIHKSEAGFEDQRFDVHRTRYKFVVILEVVRNNSTV